MSEKWNVELHMSPVGWTAEVKEKVHAPTTSKPKKADIDSSTTEMRVAASDASGKGVNHASAGEGVYTVTCALPQLSEAAREAILAELRERPLALYALLRSSAAQAQAPVPAELAALLPTAVGFSQAAEPTAQATLGAAATCSCGSPGCAHVAAAVQAAAARYAAEPLLQLAHAGLPREALLAGVLGSWAEELALEPSGPGRAAETAGRPQARGGEGGAAVGEWIAEAAAEGAMHQPGPGFGAVQVQLAQPGKPPATPELTALLPGVPAVAGLTLIRERVAARIWQAVQKKNKDSKATK
ncbi:hypothetical protein [Paenibacillus tundrae]